MNRSPGNERAFPPALPAGPGTSFALGWLENGAEESPFLWNGFREKFETALDKIRVEKIWTASETCHSSPAT
jgi:hypothetical protein